MTTHLVVPDIHCHPNHSNDRAFWLANLILDVRPDVVVNLGDTWDFPSLASYDKGTRSFVGRTYKADLNAGLDFHEKLFSTIKKQKKKLPRFVYLEGNHEHRPERALELSPELTGTISWSDLDLDRHYTDIVRYSGKSTPGTIEIDGVTYAHYLISGNMGRPLSGLHHAYSLVTKQFTSCTVGHSHERDFWSKVGGHSKQVCGLVAGCFIDYYVDWAGEQQKTWWKGVTLCHDVEDGSYEPEFISLERLKRIYGQEKPMGIV